jgi:hypothetical protein
MLLVVIILLCALLPVSVPDMLVYRVENGTLYTLQFHNGTTSTLTYNLSAVFSFYNAEYNTKQVRVAKIAMALLYGGQKLGADNTSLPTFELQPSQAAMVPLDVRGQQQITSAMVVAGTLEEDAGLGYYTLEAKLHLRTLEHRWCDSSCMLSFLPPTPLRGGPYMFDGEECEIKCQQRGIFLNSL